MRTDKKAPHKPDKKTPARSHKQGVVGYSKKSALLEEAITHMNTGKYGRSSAALKELLALDPQNAEARRLFATLHLRLGSLVTAREAFESLANEAIGRQDYWLAESLLKEYLAAGPRCIPFLERLADVYQEKGDEFAAVGELGKAIEILLEDPDPDNPKKPSQLYQRVRDLAPGSPVAFRYSSVFDVQTGEFLVQAPGAPGQPSEAPVTERTFSGPIGSAVAPADEPEIMPWERMENVPSTVPALAPAEPSSAVAEHAGEAAVQAQPFLRPSDSGDQSAGPAFPESLPATETVASAVESSTGQETLPPEPLHSPTPEPDPQVEGTSTSIWRQQDESISPTILEPSEPSLVLQAPDAPLTVPESSTTVPPPMPWDQVADSSVQIHEPEPAADIQLGASMLREETATAQPAPAIEQAESQTPSDQAEFGDRTAISATHAQEQDPEPFRRTVIEPASVEPAPSSSAFSWKSIFDSAWKVAVGPSAPSASVTVDRSAEEPPVAKEMAKQAGFAVPGQSTTEVPSSPSFEYVTDPVEPAVDRVDSQAWAERSGDVPVAKIGSTEEAPVSHLAVDPNGSVAEPMLPPSAAHSVEETIAPRAAAVESAQSMGSTVFSYPSPASLTQEPSSQSVPPSFSLVEEHQDIPSPAVPPMVEDVQALAVEPESVHQEDRPTVPLLAEDNVAAWPAPPVLSVDPPARLSEPSAPLAEPSSSAPVAKATEAPPAPQVEPIPPAHWRTGEVAVQVHRPSAKKRRWEQDTGETPKPAVPPPVREESQEPSSVSELANDFEAATASPEPIIEMPVDPRPEWVQASDAITLTSRSQSPAWHESTGGQSPAAPASASSTAASAVDVLFGSSGRIERDTFNRTTERLASPKRKPWILSRLARLRISIVSLIWSCFSTTRAFVLFCVSLVVLSAVAMAVAVGMVGLAWIVMEEPASTRYQNLLSAPQRVVTEHDKNGYFLLLGFDAAKGQDPVQIGYERKPSENDMGLAQACLATGQSGGSIPGSTASGNVVQSWFKNTDPLAQARANVQTVKTLAAQEATALERYQHWMSMPFDDWGYGQLVSPKCDQILLAHRLYLLDGFAQDPGTGLARLEKDLEAWRTTLGQSKTLTVKMLAAAAVRDDVSAISGLLMRADTDGATVNRLARLVRPLDQVELSVRWPMQSHFVWATHNAASELKKIRAEDHPPYVTLAASLPLPVQRRANAYAEYYDAANKAVAEGRYTNLPRPSSFMRTSTTSVVDYLANPIERLLGVDPLPAWDPFVGQMVETDAQLRLASLQVLARRGSQEKEVLTRLAKAGQAYYDPFTGLPMLVNQPKRLLYSVGRDGKDQEGDAQYDVVVAIPAPQSVPSEPNRTAK